MARRVRNRADMLVSLLVFAAAAQIEPCGLPVVLPTYPFPQDTVLGVRDDPLAAYDDLAASLYPLGIPTSERGVALQILREARLRQAIGPAAPPAFYGPPSIVAPPVLPEPGLDLVPLSRDGRRTDAIELRLALDGVPSGAVTAVVVATERELIPRAGEVLVEARRHPRELARQTGRLDRGRSVVRVSLPPVQADLADTAAVFLEVRVAGVGTARGFAGTVPLRSVLDQTPLTDSVVLSSERPVRQVVRP